MKKIMKKIAFAVLAIVMVNVVFGCDRQPADENDVRLTLRAVWNGVLKVPLDQNNPVAAAIREKTGVSVTFESIMMSELENLNLMFASGDMPDIVNAPFWGTGDPHTEIIKRAAAQGLLHPIQDMLEKYPNVKRAYDVGVVSLNYLEQDLMDPSFNGNLYFIPQQTPGSPENITNWCYGVFVRGDVAETLGIDPASIKTHQDLYDFMVRARDYGFRDVNGNATITATTFHNGW